MHLILFVILLGITANSECQSSNSKANKFHLSGLEKLNQKEYKAAAKLFNKAIRKDRKFVDAYLNKARAYYFMDEFEKSNKVLDELAKFAPHYGFIHEIRGSILYAQGDCKSALDEFDIARTYQIESASLYAKMGQCLHQIGMSQRALLFLDKAISLDENLLEAINNRALIRYEQEDFVGAIIDLEKLIELNPNAYDYYSALANLYAGHQQFDEAMHYYNEFINIRQDVFEAFFDRGSLLANLQQYNEAIRDLTKVIAINETHEEAISNRGYCRYLIGEYEEAISDFKQLIELNPKNEEAQFHLTMVYDKKNNVKEVLEGLGKLIAMSDENKKFYYYERGAYLSSQGDFEKGLKDFDSALVIDPTYLKALEDRATVKSITGDYQGALDDAEKIIQLKPESINVYEMIGYIKEKLDDMHGAIKAYTHVLKNRPDDYKTLLIVGDLYDRTDNYEKALYYLDKAVAINPSDLSAIYRRASLKLDNKKDLDGAEEDFEKIVKHAATRSYDSPEDKEILGISHFKLSLISLQKKEMNTAMYYAKLYTASNPNDTEGKYLLAAIHFEREELEKAMTYLAQVVDNNPPLILFIIDQIMKDIDTGYTEGLCSGFRNIELLEHNEHIQQKVSKIIEADGYEEKYARWKAACE